MNPLLGIFYVFNQQEGDQGAGGGSAKKIHTILKQNEAAADIMAAMWIDGLFKRPGKAVKRKFTTTQAQELVNLCKKYKGKMDVKAVFKKYSQTMSKEGDLGNMSEFLQSFEGMLESELKQISTQKDKNSLNVDKENQLVVHDKGLEKEKRRLQGTAKEAREVSSDTVTYKPEGAYSISYVQNSKYSVGSTLELQFLGTYHGKPARFDRIVVEIVKAPMIKGKIKYVKVKFPYDQYLEVEGTKKKVYFLKKSGSFHVKIK